MRDRVVYWGIHALRLSATNGVVIILSQLASQSERGVRKIAKMGSDWLTHGSLIHKTQQISCQKEELHVTVSS